MYHRDRPARPAGRTKPPTVAADPTFCLTDLPRPAPGGLREPSVTWTIPAPSCVADRLVWLVDASPTSSAGQAMVSRALDMVV